jgi:hypothetical protein
MENNPIAQFINNLSSFVRSIGESLLNLAETIAIYALPIAIVLGTVSLIISLFRLWRAQTDTRIIAQTVWRNIVVAFLVVIGSVALIALLGIQGEVETMISGTYKSLVGGN